MRRVAGLLLTLTAIARAAPPEPSGPHPRMLLDAGLRGAWTAQAKAARGPVVGAVALCTSGQSGAHDRGGYQGSEWARVLQACLVAWAATERPAYATTAVKFMTALLDDRDQLGDGQGGDRAAQRDSGYAIRNHAPYTALAYDWLHATPQMTPPLRRKARQRWKAWLDWYRAKGYRARVPGTNYQAAYLASATMIAIAQGGEADEEGGRARWAFVADQLWGEDMAAAFAEGGILDGGDWPEGWQYGPLAVAHYALAARIARAHGIQIDGVQPWLASVLRRHVYGLSPGDEVFVGQDTEYAEANLPPHVLTLDAVALGDAAAEDKRWAKGELARLKMVDEHYLLYDALAGVGERPAPVPRETWPTWYAAVATGTVFARTRWDERAVWFVTECQRGLDVDHRHPKAGNFVLSRGTDDVIVDPSPYGSRSTLTSNAPTVASAQLPASYLPSQAAWSERVGWQWATQTRSGVVATRCDYADAYKFQHRSSDVPVAVRDLVLLPSSEGTDAVLVVVDRARTNAPRRAMHVRFRVPGGLSLERETGTKVVGGTKLTITNVARSSGTPTVGRTAFKDCDHGQQKGQCDAARFEVSDYRLELAGPEPRAAHVIAVTAATGSPAVAASLAGPGWAGVQITSPRPATVLWPTTPSGTLRYRAAPGTHVILGAPQVVGMATITATRDGSGCNIVVAPGGITPARPAIFTVSPTCAIAVDPASATAASAHGTLPPPRPIEHARSSRSGCCGAQRTPGAPVAMTLGVLVVVLRRRR